MHGIPTIAWLTLHESLRRRVLLVALILGLAFLLIFAAGFYAITNSATQITRGGIPAGPTRLVAPAFLTMAGFYAVNFMVIMMAVLMPVDTLSGEMRSGAIQSLVTKPIRRSDVVLGKWLGFWLILMGYLLLALLGIGAVYSAADPGSLLVIASKVVVYAAFSLSLLWWVSPREVPPFLRRLPGGQTLVLAYSRFKRPAQPELD